MSKSSSKKYCDSRFCRIIVALIVIPISFFAFILALYILRCNEGNAISRAKTLEEGKGIVISIDANYIDNFNEGQLVHVTGYAFTNDALTDKTFSVSVPSAIKFRRVVEMYQWKEYKHIDGQGNTYYTHSEVWSEHRIDSRRFSEKEGHHNPFMQVHGQTLVAKPVILGELFTLSPSLVAKMNHCERLPVTEEMFKQMPKMLYERELHLNQSNYYFGDDPNSFQIGDLRVKFEVVAPDVISVVAKQAGSELSAYPTQQAYSHIPSHITEKAGYIELLEYGSVDAKMMFIHARIYNFYNKLPRRIVGFVIMFVGIYMAFVVLGRLEAFMPFLSSIVEWSRGWISLAIVAATATLIFIGFIWIDYMPILAMILMLIAVSLLGLLKSVHQLQEVPKHQLPEATLIEY